jgi:pimeloyl-ACP methyl ester carboxylesterase
MKSVSEVEEMASMAFEASSLPRMTIRGANLAYKDLGEGQPLVLIHANISDIRSWDPVAPHLAKNFRVITYSRRYAWPNDEIQDNVADPWQDHADDLEAMIEKLDIAPAHLMGNSTGATVALLLAKKRPDLVKSLILEEPPLISLFLPTTPPPLMDVLKLLWFHRSRVEGLLAWCTGTGLRSAVEQCEARTDEE